MGKQRRCCGGRRRDRAARLRIGAGRWLISLPTCAVSLASTPHSVAVQRSAEKRVRHRIHLVASGHELSDAFIEHAGAARRPAPHLPHGRLCRSRELHESPSQPWVRSGRTVGSTPLATEVCCRVASRTSGVPRGQVRPASRRFPQERRTAATRHVFDTVGPAGECWGQRAGLCFTLRIALTNA